MILHVLTLEKELKSRINNQNSLDSTIEQMLQKNNRNEWSMLQEIIGQHIIVMNNVQNFAQDHIIT